VTIPEDEMTVKARYIMDTMLRGEKDRLYLALYNMG